MWEGRTDVPITDQDILKRIKSYQKQDEAKRREVVELTVEQVRNLLANPVSVHCNKRITWSNWRLDTNWSLDRKDNSKSHSIDNIDLSCIHCNVSKKDLEQHIFFWDTETHTVPPNDNVIYSVGFVKSDEYALRDENYDKLMDDA